MSAKMSNRRRAAFLRALEATGNQTLAAERACVSRSWVSQQRAADPEFRRASDAAIGEARQSFDRLRTSGDGSRRPPKGWGHLDGIELVVRGSGGSAVALRPAAIRAAAGAAPQDERKGGRRVQIARARVHQWTPRVEQRFLAALRATCNVKAACAAVGMSKGSAYAHRRRWPDFARRWEEAIELGYEMLDGALLESAFNTFAPPEEIEPDAPVVPMTVSQVIHYLSMHRNAVKGVGGRPGRRLRTPDQELRSMVRRLGR